MTQPRKQLGDPLTRAEIKVIRLLAQGYRYIDIAAHLGIEPTTVHRHVQDIMAVLGLRSRTLIAVYAIKAGLIALEDIDLTSRIAQRNEEASEQPLYTTALKSIEVNC